MKVLGKWTKSNGSIIVKIPKWRETVRGKKVTYEAKYIGSPDEPFPPFNIEKDMLSEFKIHVKLVPKSNRGGDIVELG